MVRPGSGGRQAWSGYCPFICRIEGSGCQLVVRGRQAWQGRATSARIVRRATPLTLSSVSGHTDVERRESSLRSRRSCTVTHRFVTCLRPASTSQAQSLWSLYVSVHSISSKRMLDSEHGLVLKRRLEAALQRGVVVHSDFSARYSVEVPHLHVGSCLRES